VSVLPASRPHDARTAVSLVVLTLAPALLVLFARIAVMTDPASVRTASTLIAGVSLVHGMALFVLHGRDRLTMSGCFLASSAMIVGASGLLVVPDPYFLAVPHPDRFLNSALFAAALTQIAVGALCLRIVPEPAPPPPILPGGVARTAQISGVAVLAVTAMLGEALGPFQDGFGFSAILLVCVASLLGEKGLRSPGNALLVLAALAAFPTLVISGTGRLRVIALLLAVAYVFFLRYGRRWMKTLGVLLAPLGLMVLGIWRREYEEAVSGAYGNETGLSSMFVAIGNFGTLLHSTREGLAPTLGASFLSPLGSALPDALRPAWIPQATGYELAAITDPELYGTGFSTVASVYGDLWWNAGALGLIAGAPLLAVMLDRIDAWTVRSVARAAASPRRLLLVVLWTGVLGGVGDLVWSGFHTWIVRGYARIAALAVLAAATLAVPQRAPTGFVSFREAPAAPSPRARRAET